MAVQFIVFFLIINSVVSNLLENEELTNCTCVPFFQCSDDTGYLVTDGTGLFDVRGFSSKCTGYFDVCCDVPVTPNLMETTPMVPSGCGYLKSKKYPWSGALLHKSGSSNQPSIYKCGATLIHEQVMITAAHCLNMKNGFWVVRIGKIVKEISNIIIHPKFSSGTLQNDIALLILENPVGSINELNLMCIPPPGITLESAWCAVTDNNFDHTKSKSVHLPIVPRNRCQKLLRETRLGQYFILHNSFICAGAEYHRKSCSGDGGNPLICLIPGQPKRYHQVGIVSWGIGCGENDTPGVYVNLAIFRDWIDEVMMQNHFNINTYRY